MIWLTWRQFRTQAIAASLLLAVIAAILVVTGIRLAHFYATSGIAACQAAGGDCRPLMHNFLQNHYSLLQSLAAGVLAVPAVIGIFWGAPLVARELEAGTYRLAWTQSVSRTRWLTTKLLVVGFASITAAAILSLTLSWWFSPIDHARYLEGNRFTPGAFDLRGLVPIGYAAFAFALGVTAGVLIRRPLPAMGITLVAFVIVRIAVTVWLRPNLMPPAHQDFALDPVTTGYGQHASTGPGGGLIASAATLLPAAPDIPNAWIYSTDVVDTVGHSLAPQIVANTCPELVLAPGPDGSFQGPAPARARDAGRDCVTRIGATYHGVVTYQPANRYWKFQAYEMGIYFAAALFLAGFSFWWVRHRLS